MKKSGFYLTEKQIKERVECFCHIRQDSKYPIGMVVLDKKGCIGWSLYNEKAERERAKKDLCMIEIATTDKGLLIALNRAADSEVTIEDIKNRMIHALEYRSISKLPLVREAIREIERITERRAEA